MVCRIRDCNSALLLYPRSTAATNSVALNSIEIGSQKAQMLAKSVMVNNPKMIVNINSAESILSLFEKKTPKLIEVKNI
jgi:hypothetical protein